MWRTLNAKEPFVLSFLDLDNFKMVNDSLGHAMGDKLLKRISSKLSVRLRSEDKVYRLAGDEFVVLSLGTIRPDMAENLGQRIKAAIAEAIDYTCPNLPVSASVGVLQVTTFEETSLEKLLARADELMYEAKKPERTRFWLRHFERLSSTLLAQYLLIGSCWLSGVCSSGAWCT